MSILETKHRQCTHQSACASTSCAWNSGGARKRCLYSLAAKVASWRCDLTQPSSTSAAAWIVRACTTQPQQPTESPPQSV